ncbi:hypothetical protein CFP65_5458 [Kitasatospora sp. MMS16-BH015]|uniref:hypothetical protein n=1 Tax=Kitasatospora sp. MMS16-BH015 TaxID=2018025 RepID=UPI000CA1F6AA|nr:hypothetical protein [Kitasatospora sp. MMS16-BH015]AUG80160.1 hypothetical protein CFP65_5458 [Kitasatospora sp. MMS16-BH015]
MTTPVNFRNRLGAELTSRAAQLPPSGSTVQARPRHTRRLVATGFGLAAAITAVALAQPHGAAPSVQAAPSAKAQLSTVSYQVTPNANGTVSLQLMGADWSGLQEALRSVGVPALVMTPSADCHTKVADSSEGLEKVMELDPKNGRIAILHPSAIPSGEKLLLLNTASKDAPQPATVSSLDLSLTKQTPACYPLSQTNVVGVG